MEPLLFLVSTTGAFAAATADTAALSALRLAAGCCLSKRSCAGCCRRAPGCSRPDRLHVGSVHAFALPCPAGRNAVAMASPTPTSGSLCNSYVTCSLLIWWRAPKACFNARIVMCRWQKTHGHRRLVNAPGLSLKTFMTIVRTREDSHLWITSLFYRQSLRRACGICTALEGQEDISEVCQSVSDGREGFVRESLA